MNHPDLWEELKTLSRDPDIVSKSFRYGETIDQTEKKIRYRLRQTKLDFENPATG